MSHHHRHKLHVIAVISNPKEYESRYRLYRQFAEYMESFHNVVLWTVELAIGSQEFQITNSDDPCHVQVRGQHALWHKENLINIGVKHLPKNWKYMAAIDADVIFADPHWADKTIAKLQEYPIVQMFSEIHDLYTDNTIKGSGPGFMYNYCRGKFVPPMCKYGSKVHGAPGFAWAYTREGFNAIGGLIDCAIMGSADWYMAHGYFGFLHDSVIGEIGETCPEYRDELIKWQINAIENIKGRVGYVPGAILHYWHGKRSDRGYETRNKYLIDNEYSPLRHVCYNIDGVLEFTNESPGLLSGLLEYFASRKEDHMPT